MAPLKPLLPQCQLQFFAIHFRTPGLVTQSGDMFISSYLFLVYLMTLSAVKTIYYSVE
jgi:hypothetical protein